VKYHLLLKWIVFFVIKKEQEEIKMFFKLLRNANIYAPEYLGENDILIAGEKIALIEKEINISDSLGEIEEFQIAGKKLVPGYIDYHNHFLGGGGGTGFASRVPAMKLSQFSCAGITTAVAGLGMDSTTKSMPALLGVAQGLQQEGLTTYIYSGSTFGHPIVTLTGSVRTDLIYIEKIIGVGEVSLSENGPSLETFGTGPAYIAKIASEAFLAGRLAQKSGVVILQVPTVHEGLEPLFEILKRTGLPAKQFVPAHANTNKEYLQQVIRFAKLGGTVDLTSSYSPEEAHPNSIKASKAVKIVLENDISIEQITITTDGNGAYPLPSRGFSYYLDVGTLHQTIKELVLVEGFDLADAVKLVTLNPARVLQLEEKKGHIAVENDADLLILDDELNIDSVFARGSLLVKDGKPVVRGTWEHLNS